MTLGNIHLRQSWSEIEHYSIAYFYRITALKHCTAELPLRAGLIALCKLMNTYHVYTAYMSPPALNGSSSPQRFEHGNAIEIRNGKMFDFYLGLPYLYHI